MSPPSLSTAIARGSLPENYFKAIEEQCGIIKDELFEQVEEEQPQLFTSKNNSGNNSQQSPALTLVRGL